MAVAAERTGRVEVKQGRRRAEVAKRPSRLPQQTALVLGAAAGGVAWFFLVRAAIDFGRVARSGDGAAWTFTGAATLGATVCLLLVFVLGARLLVSVGLISEYKPRRAAGRRTAR